MNKKNYIGAEIRSDGRLLIVRYFGDITVSTLNEHLTDVINLANQTTPGFTLLTDLSRLEAMEYSCTPIIAKIMDHFNSRQVAKIVRVIPDGDKDIGFSILSMFHYNTSIPITTCENLSEAEALLVNHGRS